MKSVVQRSDLNPVSVLKVHVPEEPCLVDYGDGGATFVARRTGE